MEESFTNVTPKKLKRGYTYAKKHKILYKWELNDINSRLKPSQDKDLFLSSSEFTTGSQINDKWRLDIYFNNGPTPAYSADNLTLFLKNFNNVSVEYSFFFLNNKQERLFLHDFIYNNVSNKDIMYGRNFTKKDLLAQKSELMANDILTVCAEVTVTDNETTVPVEDSLNSSKGQLVEDLKGFYNNRVSGDVTIMIGDKQFEAHKFILMARSPVLAAMFTHDMTEKKSNQVSITDIAPEIFEKLLEYIYTDQVSNLDLVAADLLEAADKYQLQSLKKVCEISLCKNLNCDNAIEIMALADRHNATNLAKYVSKCIAMDGENIINSNGFKEMEKSSIGFKLFKSVIDLRANNETVYSS